MGFEEAFGRNPPLVAQHRQKRPLRIQLRRIAQLQQNIAGNPVNPHRGPAGAFVVAQAGRIAQQPDHLQLLQQHGIEGDLIETAVNIARRARRAGTLDGIDLYQDGVARGALRTNGVIVGLPA
ncbi:hypothetical protein ACE0DR_27215 [Azotobacter sp. CWF10]